MDRRDWCGAQGIWRGETVQLSGNKNFALDIEARDDDSARGGCLRHTFEEPAGILEPIMEEWIKLTDPRLELSWSNTR